MMKAYISVTISQYPHRRPDGKLSGIYLQIPWKLKLGVFGPPKGRAIIQFVGVGANLFITVKVPPKINYLTDVSTLIPILPGGSKVSRPPWRGAIKSYSLASGAIRYYLPYTLFAEPIPPELKVTCKVQAEIFKHDTPAGIFLLMAIPSLVRSYFNN